MTLNILPNLRRKFEKVRLVVFDVDGTLTDGGMYYGSDGELMKRFSVKDGMGITLLRQAGIQTAFVTAESSTIALRRAEKLRVDYVVLSVHDKLQEVRRIAQKAGVTLDAVAYMGDDVNDIPAIEAVGVSGCPADAVTAVKERVDYVTEAAAGYGAAREFCDLILVAQDRYPHLAAEDTRMETDRFIKQETDDGTG